VSALANLVSMVGGWSHTYWWCFGAAATLHFIGLCMLVGSVLLMDLRALNIIRGVSYATVMRFTPMAACGLGICVLSGATMLCAHPAAYLATSVFRWKMLALLCAVANAVWFTTAGHSRLAHLQPQDDPDLFVRASGAFSIASWLAVILLGRSIFVFASVG
jgi:hypothetical protein